MRHIRSVTKGSPARANAIQDVFCQVARFMADLLESFGGSSPVLNFIASKCDTSPNGDGNQF